MTYSTSNPLKSFLADLKEYWFLIALVISGGSLVLYMVVYRVTPWDAHIETRNRRVQTEHHVQVGFDLLERGRYPEAKAEFDRALSLIDTDDSAISGRYLSELFIDMLSPKWNPAVGLSLKKRFEERFRGNLAVQNRRHILEKYIADLHAGVGNFRDAKKHYENVIEQKKDYFDPLDSYYGVIYAHSKELGLEEEERLRKQVELGESMVKIDPHDYRGLHALGFSLYEQAIAESDEGRRSALLERAQEHSKKASRYKGNEFTVVADFGEIMRPTDPWMSLSYHTWADEILDMPKELQPRDTLSGIILKLHQEDKTIILAMQAQMKSLVKFYLALDYLAMHRLYGDRRDLDSHRKFLSAAEKLDAERSVRPIYENQLMVLDIFLPPN